MPWHCAVAEVMRIAPINVVSAEALDQPATDSKIAAVIPIVVFMCSPSRLLFDTTIAYLHPEHIGSVPIPFLTTARTNGIHIPIAASLSPPYDGSYVVHALVQYLRAVGDADSSIEASNAIAAFRMALGR